MCAAENMVAGRRGCRAVKRVELRAPARNHLVRVAENPPKAKSAKRPTGEPSPKRGLGILTLAVPSPPCQRGRRWPPPRCAPSCPATNHCRWRGPKGPPISASVGPSSGAPSFPCAPPDCDNIAATSESERQRLDHRGSRADNQSGHRAPPACHNDNGRIDPPSGLCLRGLPSSAVPIQP